MARSQARGHFAVLNEREVVFLLDVDNTLLDNDRFSADLRARLEQAFGKEQSDRYWSIFAEVREALSYADYLAALQKFRIGLDDHPEILRMSSFMLEYPFAERLYPGALAAIAHLRGLGTPVVLSDGDVVFQPRKIQRSGIWDAIDGKVLIYVHKEESLDAMRRHYPARHYVMVDDKIKLLAAMKRVLGPLLTTVFVQQGHYATQAMATPPGTSLDPAPDVAIPRIADLLDLDPSTLLAARPMHSLAANLERT